MNWISCILCSWQALEKPKQFNEDKDNVTRIDEVIQCKGIFNEFISDEHFYEFVIQASGFLSIADNVYRIPGVFSSSLK